MGSRPMVGRGQGSAKVILPAPVYWDYAKAGRSLDNLFWRRHNFCSYVHLAACGRMILGTTPHPAHAKTVGKQAVRGVHHVSEAWAVYKGIDRHGLHRNAIAIIGTDSGSSPLLGTTAHMVQAT